MVAAGKRLTFVTEEEDFEIFFKSKNVDFQEAVQEAVWRTGKKQHKMTTLVLYGLIKLF